MPPAECLWLEISRYELVYFEVQLNYFFSTFCTPCPFVSMENCCWNATQKKSSVCFPNISKKAKPSTALSAVKCWTLSSELRRMKYKEDFRLNRLSFKQKERNSPHLNPTQRPETSRSKNQATEIWKTKRGFGLVKILPTSFVRWMQKN